MTSLPSFKFTKHHALLLIIALIIGFQNCSPIGFQDRSAELQQFSSVEDQQGGMNTGDESIDSTVTPVLTDIEGADPDFHSRAAYYFKLDMTNAINLLVQKVYVDSPESCSMSYSGQIAMFPFSKTRDLKIASCAGFIRADHVWASNGGACPTNVIQSRHVTLGTGAEMNRTIEIDSDCRCFYRHTLTAPTGQGRLDREVRSFAPTDVCAQNFAEYR